MNRYASGTSVSADRSRAEIELLLRRFGADGFGYWSEGEKAAIEFKHRGMRFRFAVKLPDRNDEAFTRTGTGRDRKADAALRLWEADIPRRWRSLCLVVKAMLVGVEDGVLEFEQAFMPYIVLPDGKTLSHHMLPMLNKAVASGKMPKLLMAERT